MIGFYNYTVVLTYVGALFGFAGVGFIWHGDLRTTLFCLMAAGLCDMFDGKIASTMERTKQEKRFGVQIDSLSDLICFGVLPAMIAFHCSEGQMPHALASAAYVLCALIRLAWFNVNEEERQDVEEGSREAYLGLPVTAAAVLLPLSASLAQLSSLSLEAICPTVLLLMAIAFLSPCRIKKPKAVGKVVVVLCGIATFALTMIGVQ